MNKAENTERCARCGRPLHLLMSKARGYGLVCWGKRHPQLEFWPELSSKRQEAVRE